jgi:hypothetical protein
MGEVYTPGRRPRRNDAFIDEYFKQVTSTERDLTYGKQHLEVVATFQGFLSSRDRYFRVKTHDRMMANGFGHLGVFPAQLTIMDVRDITPRISSVRIENGNIFFQGPDSPEIKVTDLGMDRDAQLSPDGRRIVFIRAHGSGTEDDDELILAQVDGRQVTVSSILRGPAKFQSVSSKLKRNPQWAPDGRLIFFLVHFGDTSFGLVKLDMESKKLTSISDAIHYYVVPRGKYAGNIVAHKRKHTLVFPWYWYWLLDTDGREIGPIGDSSNLDEFEDRYVRIH